MFGARLVRIAGSYDPVTKQMVNAFVYRVERLDLWTVKNSKGKKMNYDKLLNYPEELTGATAGGLSIITCTQTNGKPTSVKNRLIVRAYLVGPYTPPS